MCIETNRSVDALANLGHGGSFRVLFIEYLRI